MSDITSRPTTYGIVLAFYAIGFVVAASCSTIAAYTVGVCFTAFGKSGLGLLGDIIVADLTPLEWRAFFGSMLSVPFLITTPIDGFISDAFIPGKWRWGLGMFAIMVPALLVPAICTLYVMQHKAAKHGMVSMGASGFARRGETSKLSGRTFANLAWQGAIDIDLLGLVLLGFAFALILLPFNLEAAARGGWNNPSMIAMIVVGFVILMLFGLYEVYLAPKPLITRSILRNKAFLAAVGVDVTSQLASGLRTTYFPSYTYVIKDWSNYNWTLFGNSLTLMLCLLGPIGGLIHRRAHRYKTLMIVGGVGKIIGSALLLDGSRSTQSTGRLVASQIMLGFGAFDVIGARVGSQASVPHEDVAMVIASLSLWSTLGGSIGYSISPAIWTNTMLPNMRQGCPADTPAKTLDSIYASIKTLRKYPRDSTIRMCAIAAYERVDGTIFIVATVVAACTFLFYFLMPNYYLGKQQNAVTNTGLDGRGVDVPVQDQQDAPPRNLWQKLRKAYFQES